MNVVLVEPEIHWNTGNIGRTCLGLGARLHLVEPLGFSLDSKEVRRAGLDYWDQVDLKVHKSWTDLVLSVPNGQALRFFSSDGLQDYWQAPYEPDCWLVFGKESVGLPAHLKEKFAAETYRVPHSDAIRSLNLSTAVGVVLYEAVRKQRARASVLRRGTVP